jgi:hypothetical protein
MGDLAEGMHASIGAPCRMQAYWTIGQARQTGLKRALNRDRTGLDLPAVIARATIFEQQLQAP